MQLKVIRSQRQGGLISKSVIFCIDARVYYTQDEVNCINRYKIGNQLIYSSEAAKRHQAKGDELAGTGIGGNMKAIGSFVLARMALNISINSIGQGHHIECKDLNELLGAEETIMDACKNIKQFLEVAATFDGTEILVNFDGEEPEIAAQATPPKITESSPQPALVVDPQTSPPPSPPLLESQTRHASEEDWEPSRYGQGNPSFFETILSQENAPKLAAIIAGILIVALVLFLLASPGKGDPFITEFCDTNALCAGGRIPKCDSTITNEDGQDICVIYKSEVVIPGCTNNSLCDGPLDNHCEISLIDDFNHRVCIKWPD